MGRVIAWLLGLKTSELDAADTWFPVFSAEYNNWVILGLFVLFAGLVALTVISYLREGDISRRIKLTIAGIRIAVLVVILVVLFQPELVLRYQQDHYYTVGVLLDDSLSMSLTDRYADPALRRSLAAKLGVDDAELQALSRKEIVRRILARRGGPLGELSREHRLMLLRFSTSEPGRSAYTKELVQIPSGRASGEEVDQAEARIEEAFGQLTAGGYETKHAAALRTAAKKLQGHRVAGIVLISDGQATGGDDVANRLRSAMAMLRQRGIRVVSVCVGDEVPPENVAMVRLQGPVEVRRGSTIELTAFLANRNCGGRSVDLKLYRRPVAGGDWVDTGVSKQVKLVGQAGSGRNEAQEVTLRAEADELGEFVYKIVAESLEREFSSADNAAATKIRITDEKIKILVVSGDGGWEYQGLKDVLQRNPDRYAVSFWQQDADPDYNQEASDPQLRITQLPRKPEDLYKYEAVILYDPAYTTNGFDATFVGLLDDFVANYHGGLCYIASRKHSDLNLTGNEEVFKPLEALLPVVLEPQSLNIRQRIYQNEPVGRTVVPTAAGQDHPVLRFGRTAQETLEIWDLLPAVYWSHPVRRLKPLATTLAVSSDASDVMSVGRMERTPLVAVQYYGKGRSLYLGFDETWRWQAMSDGMFHRRFWRNVVDFLTAGRFQKKRVIITTGADQFSIGEELTISAEVYDPKYQPLQDEEFHVVMINTATGDEEVIELGRYATVEEGDDGTRRLALPPGHYRKKISLSKVGSFRLTARQDDPAYKGEVAEKTIRVDLPAEEFVHPEADPALMADVAPQGRALRIDQAEKIVEMVSVAPMTLFNDELHSLWDTPLTIVIIVMLLAAEWMARKKYNMA